MTRNQPTSETLSSVDNAWYHMDSPTNLAVITGVLAFSQPLDYNRFCATVEARLLEPYIRFRQRVREPRLKLGLPRWEIDPDFDLTYHIPRLTLPMPGDHSTLQALVGRVMSLPLDRSRPLWRLFYLDNYLEGCAVICRLHHCIADGVALTDVILSLTDAEADAPWSVAGSEPVQEESPPAENNNSERSMPAQEAAPQRKTHKAIQPVCSAVHQGMEMLVHPSTLIDAAQVGAAGSRALGKLLFLPPDQRTIFKQKCGIPKQAAWSVSIRVDEVKAIGQMMGGTINDILLSAVSGALRRYLEGRGEPTYGLNFRAVVPVNLRPPEESGQLGNRFGLVFLNLPIGVEDPIKRLLVLRRRMNEIKDSPEAVVAFGILNIIGMTPAQIEKIIISIFGMKGTTVMTNVPGPRQKLYLAGGKIDSLIFWVPHPDNLSLGVSILSYAGEIMIGVATDAQIVPDPQLIIAAFQEEFVFLKSWGKPPPSPGT
jgi:diacylglycerol O-acyltransferase / wax synthase